MTTPIAPSGDITYNNISFDELEIKWKSKPAPVDVKEEFSALSAWLPENSEELPVGKSKLSWKNTSKVGPVDIKVEGDRITLPAGYTYRLLSNLGVFKPVSEEKNVFYDLSSQWVTYTEAIGVDTAIGSPGRNTCEGTGSQEVRNRSALPATAYVEAKQETVVSLEAEYSDQALKLAKGSQIHVEVVGKVEAEEPVSNAKSKPEVAVQESVKQPARFAPWHR